tara:strand:+ start:1875 stop:2423 length:549 start_codon:yes stop_codon:yes gene_type:complete
MLFKETYLSGAHIIKLDKKEDERGFFARFWCEEVFKQHNLDYQICQINTSMTTKKGTLRGLHFQVPPKAETKIVRCISGCIWDVIVDLRTKSKTYGKWFGVELSSKNKKMIYVPKGFAHGFITLKDKSEIIYLVSESYSGNHELGLRWDDSFHGIDWPIKPIVVSKKDSSIPDWKPNKSINL